MIACSRCKPSKEQLPQRPMGGKLVLRLANTSESIRAVARLVGRQGTSETEH